MELKQFQYFVVSVDMESLSRAAEVLYTTQPHISKTIQGMENELGLNLLERGKKGVKLTKDGKWVYEQARKILKNAKLITDMTIQDEAENLRLSSMPSNMLAGIFASFFQQEENLQVKFLEGSLERVLHQAAHRHVELGFVFVSEHQKQAFQNMINHRKLEFHLLKETRLVLFAGPKNKYYNRKSVTLADLQKIEYVQDLEEDLLLFNYPGHLNETVDNHRHFHKAVTVDNDYVMMRLLTETGMGNISSLLHQEVAQGNGIRAIPFEDYDIKVEFGYVKRTDKTLSDCGSRFIQFIKNKLR